MSGPRNVTDDKFETKLLVWGFNGIEPGTIEQAQLTARMPFVHSHVALMPDAHVGFGSTVGSVIATSRAVMPATIGVDIGCGMAAFKTGLTANDLPDNLGPVHGAIRGAVPAGVGQGHDSKQPLPDTLVDDLPALVRADDKLLAKCHTQFGTLGSGNHFVEVCLDQNDDVWVVLHSGSRGVGKTLAEQHVDQAKALMVQWFITPPHPDLAYLVEGTEPFKAYVHDMLWAQAFAAHNRAQMLDNIRRALSVTLQRDIAMDNFVSCHHNYTERENHGGKNLWVTRKGAIRARVGDRGIIPGSMGTSSYIVRGLGNEASFSSASHGAGRRLSRGAARRELSVDSLRDAMKGKAWNDRDAKLLVDEHPDAYKSIDDVMSAQADLVEIEFSLRQVVNYKGAEEGRRGKR